jgi:RNA polymerase sigma factor (sigma-70 family)
MGKQSRETCHLVDPTENWRKIGGVDRSILTDELNMTQPDEQFQVLMRKAMAGSDAAARKLFESYEMVLLQAIRRKLNKKVRSKFDSTDFAQDVWASFFARPVESRVFDSPENLLAFLTTLAKNKVTDAIRQHLTVQRYDVHREQSLDDSRVLKKENIAARQPTPSYIAMTKEEWNVFLRKQPLVYRRVFILLREGHTHEQIGTELGISVRTVERIVAKAMAGTST